MNYHFKRAPGFFDVVAWTGDGVAGLEVPHNLGVVPELEITKPRSAAGSWDVIYHLDPSNIGLGNLDSDVAFMPTSATPPSDAGFSPIENRADRAYISYLFASVPGISKVGSYTGTGNDLNVDCGFTAGARFVFAKRTDSSGDWYVWDSARGIVAGADPYKLLNDTAVEVTNTDYIDPLSSGFTITSSAPAALNASGGSYIFYAIA